MNNVFFVALVLIAGGVPAIADSQTLGSGGVTYGPGLQVKYVTVAEPALKQPGELAFSGGFGFDASVLHRWMLDKAHRSYFGYDLLLEPIAGTPKCRVSIVPLSLNAAEIGKRESRWSVDATWRLMPLPKHPEPQVVEPGDTIALDLLASPDGTQKVVDYIRASCRNEEKPAVQDKGPQEDFTVNDVALNVVNGSLYANGKPASGVPMVGDANGPVVWFYFPGRGRFLVSIAPLVGFRKAGTIRRNVIAFEMGADRFEVRANHPIVGEKNTWNAYVMADSRYPVSGPNALLGGSESVEEALAQK